MDNQTLTYITPGPKTVSLYYFHLSEPRKFRLCHPWLPPSLPSCPSSASLELPRCLSLLPLGLAGREDQTISIASSQVYTMAAASRQSFWIELVVFQDGRGNSGGYEGGVWKCGG